MPGTSSMMETSTVLLIKVV